MPTIKDYFEQAQLAQAAYADLNGVIGRIPDGRLLLNDPSTFAPNFSQSQEAEFIDRYDVVDHLANTASGFSATLFYDKVTGAYTFALRGSDQVVDDLLISDIFGVFGTGIATAQVVDLYNYYQRLITPAGQTVSQWVPINEGGGVYYQNTGSASGLGKISSTTALNVTGHSLGGHLAAAFSRLFPNVTTAAYEINGLGFYNTSYVNGLFDQLAGQPTAFDNTKISNLYGEAGREVATNNNLHYQYGTRLPVFIEDQNSLAGNHGKELMVDSLAVASLFAMLDPTLNTNPAAGVSKIFDIMEAAAGTPGKSLENTLDALRTLFQQNYATGTANTYASPTAFDRDSFYTHLFSLESYLKTTPFYNSTTQSLGLTVEKLTNVDTGTLITNAQADIAYRYALYKLNPFAVTNAPVLYSAINSNGALDLYHSSTRSGALSDEYLKDRTAFLYNKIQANNQDNDIVSDASTLATTWTKYSGNPQYFEDTSNYLPYKLYLGPDSSIVTQPISGLSQIKFGSVNVDSLTGGDTWDKLYGMDGDDRLTGGQGNDYLEGGPGTDQYLFTTGHGLDILLDTDHQGQIQYDGITLNGGPRALQGNNVYQSPDGNFTYTLIGAGTNNTLFINTPGGEIQVKDFQVGDLGIALPEAPPPTFSSTFIGTVNHDADVSDTGVPLGVSGGTVLDSNWMGYAPLGQKVTNPTGVGGMYFISRAGQPYPENTIFEALYGNAGDDFLLGNPGAQSFTIDAGSGNDWIISDYNDKYSSFQGSTTYAPGQGTAVYGGEGHDAIQGGFRNDWIDGNTGHDQVIGLEGRDYINGGSGNDWLAGNRDDDILLGGPDTSSAEADNDRLLGGSGSDYLHGGAGDDTLYGDASGGFIRRVIDVGDATLHLIAWNGQTQTHLIPDFHEASLTTLALLADAPFYEDGGYPAPGYTPSPRSEDYLDGGTGADKLFGGVGNDILDGGADNDQLYGEAGDDQLLGGDGNDQLWGDLDNAVFNQDQQITETHGTLSLFNRQYATETLAEGHDILEGGTGDDELRGSGGNDTLIGGAGTDILVGGPGADLLDGGPGNDTIYRDAFDTIIFRPGDGQDQVTYGDGGLLQFEGLTIDQLQISSATGTDGWQYLTLTQGTDSISLQGGFLAANQTFSLGADSLTQQQLMTYAPAVSLVGTAGADTIYGGNQNDTLRGYYGSVSDPNGNDTLYGQGGNDILLGGLGSDMLDGGAGNDNLNGGANGAPDTLIGGTGDDTYRLNNFYDTIIELANEGNDWVETTGSVTLPAYVENARFVGTVYPTYGVSFIGNALDNTLMGPNSVSATLDGGQGADTMIGGDGNTTYIVDNPADQVIDSYGTDTVKSYVSYTLGSGIENLVLLGTNTISGTGSAGWNTLDGSQNNAANQLAGGTGDDFYIVGVSDTVIENANEGTDGVNVVSGPAQTYALSMYPNVENLRLGNSMLASNVTGNNGNNQLSGNIYSNVLIGDAGDDLLQSGDANDVLDGGVGRDTLQGGTGADTYLFGRGAGQDKVDDNGASGSTDTLQYTADVLPNDVLVGRLGYDLFLAVKNTPDLVLVRSHFFSSAYYNYSVEQITFTADGTIWDASAIAARVSSNLPTADSDLIIGTNGGDDILDGGAGADSLVGEAGDDTYIVDNVGDAVYEGEYSGGRDTVQSSVSYALSPHVENLILTGLLATNATGNELDNTFAGNSANNILSGFAGNDILTGNAGNDTLDGGTGNDSLNGGTGDDTYVVTDLGDTVTENPNEGTDTVQTSIAYTLGASVENLTLIGTSAINGTGNTLVNTIVGNSANNVLDGTGGADTLKGGPGDDTYVLDNTGDVITENLNEGTDTVQSSITYTLGNNVENLTLIDTTAINGTGNTLNNALIGNSANNTLNGGAGADTLKGGPGDDTYIVDNAGDSVTENPNAGTDTVQSSVTYTLGNHLENLTLIGTAALSGTGNPLANVLTGNAAANTLDGGGTGNGWDGSDSGGGNDTLVGGAGNDTYVAGRLSAWLEGIAYWGHQVGEDLIIENDATAGNIDTLRLETPADAGRFLKRYGNDLVIEHYRYSQVPWDEACMYDEYYENVRLQNYFLGAQYQIEQVQYADGTTFSLASLVAQGYTAIGTDYDDNLVGTVGNDTMYGYAGNDTLDGAGGVDQLDGGAGNDIYDTGAGNDFIYGSAGNDTYRFGRGDGRDALFGGLETAGDIDTVALKNISLAQANGVVLTREMHTLSLTFTDTTDRLYIDHFWDATNTPRLAFTDATWDRTTIEDNLTVKAATASLDVIDGSGRDDVIDGLAGNDSLYGHRGNDTLLGNTGADRLEGGEGADILDGGVGNDLLYGDAGTDTLLGGDDNDTLYGRADGDILEGGNGADYLWGEQGNDVLRGGAGDDDYAFWTGFGQDRIQESGATSGFDSVFFTEPYLDPLQLVFERTGNDLRVGRHATTDAVTVENWYTSTDNQVERFWSYDGQNLYNNQVDQLIQAMAQFSASHGGITWDQAIDQNPNEVQAVLAAYWQPAA